MNYKFFHPLFTDTEIDEASRYLSNLFVDVSINDNLYNNANTNQNSADYILDNLLHNIENNIFIEVSKAAIFDMIKDTYGVNAPMMANCYIVQNEWLNRYHNVVMDYAKALKFQIKEYCIVPNTIFIPAAISRCPENRKKELMNKFFPSDRKWDLSSISEDSGASFVNPLNDLSRVLIEFDALDKPDFTIKVASHFFNSDTVMQIIKCIKEKTNCGIVIPILPHANFSFIFRFLRDCFKYL